MFDVIFLALQSNMDTEALCITYENIGEKYFTVSDKRQYKYGELVWEMNMVWTVEFYPRRSK